MIRLYTVKNIKNISASGGRKFYTKFKQEFTGSYKKNCIDTSSLWNDKISKNRDFRRTSLMDAPLYYSESNSR